MFSRFRPQHEHSTTGRYAVSETITRRSRDRSARPQTARRSRSALPLSLLGFTDSQVPTAAVGVILAALDDQPAVHAAAAPGTGDLHQQRLNPRRNRPLRQHGQLTGAARVRRSISRFLRASTRGSARGVPLRRTGEKNVPRWHARGRGGLAVARDDGLVSRQVGLPHRASASAHRLFGSSSSQDSRRVVDFAAAFHTREFPRPWAQRTIHIDPLTGAQVATCCHRLCRRLTVSAT
jgi:hypothetical protein